MGGGASAMSAAALPEEIDEATARQFAGDKFDKAKFDAAAPRGTMSRDAFLKAAGVPPPRNSTGPWDIFMSHKQSESGRAMALISRDLERMAGKNVWLDVNMDDCSEVAMMEGVEASTNFLCCLSDGYFASPYCVSELRKAVQYEKNIILCHVEGANVGAMLKDKPPEFGSLGNEASIQLVISDPAFRKVATDKIMGKIVDPPPKPELPKPKPTEASTSAAPKPAETAVSAKCAGGFFKGDKVASKIDYEAQDLHKGDIGLVLGPCPNTKLDDQAKRIRIQFGPGKGLVDLVAEGSTAQCEPAPKLAGGYCLGDKVASKIDFDGQNLKVGNIGVITGPCPNKDLADQAKRVRVVFGPGIGQLDLVAEGSLQINPAENLCDGWCLGDRCASRIDYDAQNLCVDDIGTVIGPCPNDKLKDQKVMPNVIACMHTPLRGTFFDDKHNVLLYHNVHFILLLKKTFKKCPVGVW